MRTFEWKGISAFTGMKFVRISLTAEIHQSTFATGPTESRLAVHSTQLRLLTTGHESCRDVMRGLEEEEHPPGRSESVPAQGTALRIPLGLTT